VEQIVHPPVLLAVTNTCKSTVKYECHFLATIELRALRSVVELNGCAQHLRLVWNQCIESVSGLLTFALKVVSQFPKKTFSVSS
jgi:hypothetical protein